MTKCIAESKIFIKFFVVMFLLISQIVSLPLMIKGQSSSGNSSQLKGNTRKVLTIPNGTVDAGLVILASDRDNDGMSDDDELQNGTNPDDPSDADGDLDGDGVSNGDEVARGTNPNSADSDGDGVSDADEIRLGYDPLDPNNTPPPNTAIISLQVSPNPISLSVNTVFGATPIQLTVSGITNTGTTVNLTNDANTIYQSLDQAIAAVSTSGSVFGIAEGSSVIRVQNGTLSADATVNVGSFSPGGTASLYIPGYANNVDVAGNYAYVAAGVTGLQIVDISDRDNPFIAASYNTPGNANDVRVVNGLAYIADGVSGLQIINVSNPLNPVLTGSYDTPGEANDVVVGQNTVYVADGLSGLRILDVTNPASPQSIGTIDTPGKTRGVAVSGNYAVLAEGSPSSAVRIVNISNSATPQLVGTLTQTYDVIDVTVRDNYAFIAGWYEGLKTVSFANPASPTVIATDFNGFTPRDVTLNGDFLIAAETSQNNFVPFFNVSDPTVLNYRGGVNQTNFGFAENTGIASDDQFVYTTGVSYVQSANKGVNGYSKLFIGRYKIPDSDNNGIAPTVNLITPSDGESIREGKVLDLTANATDDVYVSGVQFKINGNIIATDSNRPYEFSYQVPLNLTTLSVTATAFDLAGNSATTTPVSVVVTPDAPPLVNIINPAENTTLVEGETISVRADASDDEYVTRVRINVNGNEIVSLFDSPYETSLIVPSGINSMTLEAEATDTVDRTTTSVRTFSVIPDPNTTVSGRVVTIAGQPVADANVTVFENFTAQTGSDGTFSIPNVPTVRGDISVKASASINNNNVAANASIPFAPVSGATTNVGDIKLSVGPTAPTAVSTGFFGSRDDNIFYGQDVFVGFGDRLSSVYSFDGTEFVPRAVGQMETGSVTAGSSSSVSLMNSYGDNLTFLQLAGQLGLISKFNANSREDITRTSLPTELSGESKFIGTGRDYATGSIVVAFLSNDEAGGAVIKLKVGNEPPITVPLPANVALNSLVLSDIDGNGYTDILAVKSLTNGAAKLISIKRNSSQPQNTLIASSVFGEVVESDITERVASPSNGLNNLIAGNFAPTGGKEVAVIGDDRVRIYNASGGGFVLQQEIILPTGQIPTGIYGYDLKNSGFSDLIITTKNATDPTTHSLFVYFNDEFGGGCPNCTSFANLIDKNKNTNPEQDSFTPTAVGNYTITNSSGDARIIVGNWGGNSYRLDVVVIEGDQIKIFFDVAPSIFGS